MLLTIFFERENAKSVNEGGRLFRFVVEHKQDTLQRCLAMETRNIKPLQGLLIGCFCVQTVKGNKMCERQERKMSPLSHHLQPAQEREIVFSQIAFQPVSFFFFFSSSMTVICFAPFLADADEIRKRPVVTLFGPSWRTWFYFRRLSGFYRHRSIYSWTFVLLVSPFFLLSVSW